MDKRSGTRVASGGERGRILIIRGLRIAALAAARRGSGDDPGCNTGALVREGRSGLGAWRPRAFSAGLRHSSNSNQFNWTTEQRRVMRHFRKVGMSVAAVALAASGIVTVFAVQ